MSHEQRQGETRIYFSDFFGVSPDVLAEYGAFNVSPIVDLPLFIDPFLLFTSKKVQYQTLHNEIIRYLQFLKDRSVEGSIDTGLLRSWYCFKEVHQNCLGFCATGTRGAGLGMDFAQALNSNLNSIFRDFGTEKVTRGSHIEKLVLIRERVGRDNISDFTTNLIKGFLLRYTEIFAKRHIDSVRRKLVNVPRVRFNFDVGVWENGRFDLPWLGNDFVLLTPEDILTKDDTWINKEDLRKDFPSIREAIPNEALRSQINYYFRSVLPKRPTPQEERMAVEKTIRRFPALIDLYIRQKEDSGPEAVKRSMALVREVDLRFIKNLSILVSLITKQGYFYRTPANTLEEVRKKIDYLKYVIECQDGYRIFYVKGKPVEREKDLQILFKLVWEGSPSSIDAEVNNGRGPVDFKVSRGANDSTLVEFKLASNSQLERNLRNQVAIYEKANKTTQSFKVILCFSATDEAKVRTILKRIGATSGTGIILIDARRDTKKSGSKV